MYNMGREAGYSMTVYRTRSLLHGVPQVRERSFYFFWQGDKTPKLNWYNKPYKSIEQTILDARGNTLQEPINKKTPSKDPYYRYILEEINGGMTHKDFSSQLEPGRARGNDTFAYIEKAGKDYSEVAEWMDKNGYEREAGSCRRKYEKLAAGGSIMRRGTVVPKDYIGAFAVSAGFGADALCAKYEAENDDYRKIMTQALADRLAEAFAEKLHRDVRVQHWGYSKDENVDTAGLLQVKCGVARCCS